MSRSGWRTRRIRRSCRSRTSARRTAGSWSCARRRNSGSGSSRGWASRACAADPPFAARRETRALVTSTLQEVLVQRTTADWIAALTAAGVPCGPINDVRSALADPQTAARELVTEVEHPAFGTARWIVSPVRVGEAPAEHRRAPGLGEHTETVLRELLGYDVAAIARFRADGAFGTVT